MTGPAGTPLAVELLPDFVDSEGRQHFLAGAGNRLMARFWAADEQGQLRIALDVDGPVLALTEWQGLLHAVLALAAAKGQAGVVLPVGAHLLERHAARSLGFVGPLRGDLVRDLREPDTIETGDLSLEDRFLSDLRLLLPGMTVDPAVRHAGWLRSAIHSASAGVAGTVRLTVREASGGPALSLALPLDDDVMPECVALAVDTAMGVRGRFDPLLDQVRLFYDQYVHGLRAGTVAGAADASVKDIHLNPAFALSREMEILDRQIRERRLERQPGTPPLTVLLPFTRIDSVVAHELWHQIEFGFEGSRYRDSVEFRRAVGGYFGVETLEHVIKGEAARSPAVWQMARARLAEEVSAYATTAPKEATAELFAQWWCTRAAPPPSATYFGQVLQRFFPPANGVG